MVAPSFLADGAGGPGVLPPDLVAYLQSRRVVSWRLPRQPDFAVAVTLAQLRRLVQESDHSPIVRGLAEAAIAGNRPDDTAGNARSIAAAVGRWAPYVRDPARREYVVGPEMSAYLISHYGKASLDCDCVATLAASLLASVGIGPVFATVIANGRRGQEYNHVFVRYVVNGKVGEIDPYTKQERKTVVRYADYRLV